MAEVRYKEVKISDVMNLISENHMYTKKFIDENKGKYPVYSATIDKPYGFISSYDFKNKKVFCVVNYGNSGKTYLINDDKFSIGRNISALEVKDELDGSVDLEYVRVVSESKFINNAKGTKQKNLNQRLVKNTKIKIPIKEDGNYDIETQKEIVKKYEIVEEKKKELQEKLDYFKDVQVDFMATELSKNKNIKISELLNTKGGNNKLTNSFINSHKGIYPVYSAKTKGDVVKGYLDSYDYNIEAIQITRNGNAGVPIYHKKHKFSITEDARIFYKKEIYEDILNLEFLTLVIKNSIESKNFSWSNKAGINKLKDLEVCVPLNEDGTFDLEKQNQIVSKYKAIEEMKKSILEIGLPFTLSNVQFDGETPYIYIYI